jgi:response regulator RpfG family c-di-GMP phosphodiesterase
MVENTDQGMPGSDFLSFAGENGVPLPSGGGRKNKGCPGGTWKLLIVDDEEEVHLLTRLVLKNFEFEGRGLTMSSSYSGAGARQILRDDPEIAIILLDVVMEREDSGLQLVRYIREELGNKNVRIILRTGQPGQAPEQEVVSQYDINDYKAKTELTAQKLFTTVTSALRSWRDIQSIVTRNKGLQKIINSGASLFEWHSRKDFSARVLKQLVVLAHCEEGSKNDYSGLTARRRDGKFFIGLGTGRFSQMAGRSVQDVVPDTTQMMVQRAERQGTDFFFNHSYVCCIRADNDEEILFLLKGKEGSPALDEDLIRIYMSNVALAFHNVNLSLEIIETQKEIIHTLGEVVETRSKETANHVLRVGKMVQLLALKMGLDPDQAAILRLAAPMHDVGKVGIPDAILNKPGPLTDEEYRVMKTHTTIGWEILGKSERRIMRSAALVAHQHHERWDGKGYPNGLAGEKIHIYGRITALVDVFDAVVNKRIYREAKELGDVVAMLRQGRGTHFDPGLVDCFLANLSEFVGVVKAHPDLTENVQTKEGAGKA